jgi:DNA-binding response OmpR family regulator
MTGKGAILVVDDTQAALKLLTGILGQEGYEVRPADSGQLALASVEERPPELILLDIRMPGMDGFEVLRRLKAREESRRIPVIILSAATELDQRVAGLRLGAVDFVRKPFEREELLARVATHLELFRLRTELELQAAELRHALAKVKTLSGFIPICASCKKLRDDKGFWSQLEQYVLEQTDAQLSHGLCPECLKKFFPDAVDDVATT